MKRFAFLVFLALAGSAASYQSAVIWASCDCTTQPLLYDIPAGSGPFPLIVILHSWGGTYTEQGTTVNLAVQTFGFAAVAPNYRGTNDHPDACMSSEAQQDIIDAVNWMIAGQNIDQDRIYLYGSSGGGHAGMFMAGAHPQYWTAVSTWVGISDLAAWWYDYPEGSPRHDQLTGIFGGPPVAPYLAEYEARSPVSVLAGATRIPMEINSGIHDATVRPYQQIRAFNIVVSAAGFSGSAISQVDMDTITTTETIPETLISDTIEPRTKTTLFARQAGNCRLIIFDGGHEVATGDSFAWLSQFTKAAASIDGWQFY